MHRRNGARAGRPALLFAFLTGALLLQGCQAAESLAESSSTVIPEHMKPPPGHGAYTGTVADWPLWFPWHRFGAYCFDTQRCEVRYAEFQHGGPDEKLQPSVESFDRPIEKILSAGWGPYPNFPSPAEVVWTSLDGTSLTASVDIAKIFSDRLVRHTVSREDILESSYIPYPGIILVVDDRAISMYMSTWLPLKKSPSQDPESREGTVHTEVVLVHTETY